MNFGSDVTSRNNRGNAAVGVCAGVYRCECLSVQVCGCVCLCQCVCACAGVSQLCRCGHVGVSEQMLACLYMCVWGMSVCTGVWVCLCRCVGVSVQVWMS